MPFKNQVFYSRDNRIYISLCVGPDLGGQRSHGHRPLTKWGSIKLELISKKRFTYLPIYLKNCIKI